MVGGGVLWWPGQWRQRPGGLAPRPAWPQLGEAVLCERKEGTVCPGEGLGCPVWCGGGPGSWGRPWAGWCPWWESGLQLCAAGGLGAGRSWKEERSQVGLEPDLVGVILCGLLTLPWLSRSVRQPPWGAPPWGGGGTPFPWARPQGLDCGSTLPDHGRGRGVVSLPGSLPIALSLPGPQALGHSFGGDAVQPVCPSPR